MFRPVDVKEKLVKARRKEIKENDISEWVDSVFAELDRNRDSIHKRLSSSNEDGINDFNFDLLERKSIFHISQIKKICIDYRLRFLDSGLFKGEYPEEAISKIREMEGKHDTKIDGFKIIAPQELFKTKKADDPLLFAPLSNDYYYLIHKWGNDLNPFRKWKYWCIQNVGNLVISVFVLSILFTMLSYQLSFNNQDNAVAYVIVIFLFAFKSIVGLILFLGAASGKNFSEFSWRSKYDKIS